MTTQGAIDACNAHFGRTTCGIVGSRHRWPLDGNGNRHRAVVWLVMLAALFFIAAVDGSAPPAAAAVAITRKREPIGFEQARAILFETDKNPPLHDKCVAIASDVSQVSAGIECMLGVRYAKDKQAKKIALELYRRTGSVSGSLPEQDFDGDYRGMLHFVPRLPVGANRKHLEWLGTSLLEIDAFFQDVQKMTGKTLDYRWGQLELRFFESVKRKTPSAIAWEWSVAYNVSGSLFTSQARVRETMFHEIFHLNDADHDLWAPRALTSIYDTIVAKCGMDTACLAPYAPDSIIVRKKGGTYYAFMPDNGVREYAADLGKRWYIEHVAALDRLKKKKKKATAARVKPFKCATPENARAWQLIVDEFFGGIDLTPPCT